MERDEIVKDFSTSGGVKEGEESYGCEHYKRKSKFVVSWNCIISLSSGFHTLILIFQTPCCNKVYTCRFCHDEQETHTVKRKEVTELICVLCDTRQPVQATCQKCNINFGKYTCLKCNLFDDEDKNQYHCEGCGICRLGGRDRFFHCAKCNMCLPIKLQNGHKVLESNIFLRFFFQNLISYFFSALRTCHMQIAPFVWKTYTQVGFHATFPIVDIYFIEYALKISCIQAITLVPLVRSLC